MRITTELVKEKNIKILTDCIEVKNNNDGKNRFHCCITTCNCEFSDKANAIRHIRLNHFEIYDSIRKNKAEKNKEEDGHE